MSSSVRRLCRGAIIAAMYCLLTILFQPISFGAVQFRIAEVLTLLPILTADAVPGLFIGCLLANLLGGGIWFDVVLGSIATLLAAIMTRYLRNRRIPAMAMPTIFNGLIVGPVVYFAYVLAPGEATNVLILLSTIGTVALGELVVCYVLGFPFLKAMAHIPALTSDEQNQA